MIRIVFLAIVFGLVSNVVLAQKSHVAVGAETEVSSGLGFHPLGFAIGNDLYFKINNKLSLYNNFDLSFTDKIGVDNGYVLSDSVYLRYHLSKKFFLGPGVSVSHIKNSQWEKTSLYPGLEAGFNYRDTVFPYLRANFRDPLSHNHGIGGRAGAEIFIPLSKNKNWGVKYSTGIGVLRFKQQRGGETAILTGFKLSNGIMLYFTF